MAPSKFLCILLPFWMKNKVIPHVLVTEEQVRIPPQAGHKGTPQYDVTNEFFFTTQLFRSTPGIDIPQGASLGYGGKVLSEESMVLVRECYLSCGFEYQFIRIVDTIIRNKHTILPVPSHVRQSYLLCIRCSRGKLGGHSQNICTGCRSCSRYVVTPVVCKHIP